MYNNKDLMSMGLTHTRVWFKQLHEKLVTCTKRTPEPLQVLSVAYLMNSGVEKKPREETNPHRKPIGREEHHSMAAFLSIFVKLPLTPRMNGHIAM